MESSGANGNDKHRCRACGVNFSTLTLFDQHRQGWRVNPNQQLVGKCQTPAGMYLVEYNGAWYTPEGKAKVLKQVAAMKEARRDAQGTPA